MALEYGYKMWILRLMHSLNKQKWTIYKIRKY